MDSDVDNVIRSCHCCRPIVRESPVQVTRWPTQPWCHLAMDIAGPKSDVNGKQFYVLAAIDLHSKYVCGRILPRVSSSDVFQFLESLFVTFGICNKLTTDNGPQFTSCLFTDFLRSQGVSHVRSSVYNPMSNGSIKRMNRNFKKVCLIVCVFVIWSRFFSVICLLITTLSMTQLMSVHLTCFSNILHVLSYLLCLPILRARTCWRSRRMCRRRSRI